MHALACTRPGTHTHARTHRQISNTGFSRQQWFRESVSVLRYTYISCLVEMSVLEEMYFTVVGQWKGYLWKA